MILAGGSLIKFRKLLGLAILILALIPLLVLIINVAKYHVDVPFWDQWNFVPLLGKSYEEGVTFQDLWGQHNEHRLLFPRLIMLGLAHASRYNIVWELVVIILLAAGIFVLLWNQFSRTIKALGYFGFPWAVPIFSLLVFSLGQSENWLWGWQIQIFLNVLAAIAGLILLGSGAFRWGKFLGALGFGILATYSFANGLIFWPLGFLALILAPFGRKGQKTLALTAWTAATTAVAISYLCQFRYESPSGKPWTQFLNQPGDYLQYLLKYLGRPVINYEKYALAIGLIGLLLFGAFSFLLFRKKHGETRALLPFFLFGFYSIGCGLLTGIGRVGFGSAQAMSGRYVPFSILIWVSNFAFLFILLQDIRARTRTWLGRILSFAGIGGLSIILVFGIVRTSYRVGYRVFKSYHARMLPARSELSRGEDKQLLVRLYIDADHVRQGIGILKKHNLSVFR